MSNSMNNETRYELEGRCLGCESGVDNPEAHKINGERYYSGCEHPHAVYLREQEQREQEQREQEEKIYNEKEQINKKKRENEIGKQMNKLENENCAICLTKAKNNSVSGKPISTKCNHIFHKDCVKQWRTTNKSTCPICRSNIGKNNKYNIVLNNADNKEASSKKASGKLKMVGKRKRKRKSKKKKKLKKKKKKKKKIKKKKKKNK